MVRYAFVGISSAGVFFLGCKPDERLRNLADWEALLRFLSVTVARPKKSALAVLQDGAIVLGKTHPEVGSTLHWKTVQHFSLHLAWWQKFLAQCQKHKPLVKLETTDLESTVVGP